MSPRIAAARSEAGVRAFIPAVVAALCACHANGHSTIRATVRDSSGIEIVANAAPLGTEHVPWALDTVPIVDLGAREDDPHEQFSGVVIPLRLSNGHIVVATSGTSELRFFDPTGTWLHSRMLGAYRPDPEPASPRDLNSPGPSPERPMVWNLRRLSVLSPAGKFVPLFHPCLPWAEARCHPPSLSLPEARSSPEAHRPAYAGLIVGPRGTLWVQAYTAPEPDPPIPHQIFDSTGQWLGAITLPSRFKASQIGDDFVLGLWKDADDVDHVRLYRLSHRHPS